MKNNLTEIVFILDRSGSMSRLVEDTIGGFNSFIETQKKEVGEAVLTTILFDDQYEILHNGVDIKNVKPMTTKEYSARGMTALLDAIGKTINNVGDRLNKTDDKDKPSKVIFVITTDGQENSSKEFTQKQIKEMIEHGIFLHELREEVGKDFDEFDLVCHVAFDQKPLTRKERANKVKKRNYFAKYGEKAHKIIDALLDKYADEGIENIETMTILKVNPFREFGTPIEIIESFGGKEKYMHALKEIKEQLYAEV